MLRFTPFSFVVFHWVAFRRVLAALAISPRTSRAGRFRRVAATALLLSITSALAPFTPLGHAHAETIDHEADDVPAVETGWGEGEEEAPAVHGCAPFVSRGPSRPGRGVLTLSICSTQPVPGTLGLVTCEFCTCFYKLDGGGIVNLNQVDCGGSIIISNPSDDDCGDDVC